MTEIRLVKQLRSRSTYNTRSGSLGRFTWDGRNDEPYISVAYSYIYIHAYKLWKNYKIGGDEPEDAFIELFVEVLAHEFFHAEDHNEGLHLKGRKGRFMLKAEEQMMDLAGL